MDEQEEAKHGISLFKIDYEIDGQDGNIWSAGIIAHTSEEAVKSLASFLKTSVKDFKGFKIDTLAWQGAVHHLSDSIREAIVGSSVKPQKTGKKAKKKILDKK